MKVSNQHTSNCNKSGNLLEYRIGLIDKIGVDRVELLEERRKESKNWSIPELIELKVIYKDKLKQLKK